MSPTLPPFMAGHSFGPPESGATWRVQFSGPLGTVDARALAPTPLSALCAVLRELMEGEAQNCSIAVTADAVTITRNTGAQAALN